MAKHQNALYIGTGRFVLALDPKTGSEIWRTRLPHVGSSVVTLLIAGTSLYVGHSGRVYCLNRQSGEILWKNDLAGTGWHPVLFALEGAQGSSADAAAAATLAAQRQAAAGGAAV